MQIRHITPAEQFKFVGGCSNNFAGNFITTLHRGCYELKNIDAFDVEFCAGVALRQDEKIFRFVTDNHRIAGTSPLVKINTVKGLVYFLVDGAEVPEFERKGIKIRSAVFVN